MKSEIKLLTNDATEGAQDQQAVVSNPTDFFANSSAPLGADGQPIINATLRHEEHLRYDQALLEVARQRLNGIADLRMNGLVENLMGLGTMLSLYERMGDVTKAVVDMEGATMSQKDRLIFDEVGVPVPIIHKDWDLNRRQLEASRKRGEPLSTAGVRLATRIVADELETMLFRGVPNFQYDGREIYGYTNHPDRNTVALKEKGWAEEKADIIGDVVNLLKAAYADNRFGPFCLYVPKDYWAVIQTDYSDEKGDRTFYERILAFNDIMAVKAGDYLPAKQVVLVQMTRDSIDLAVGADIMNIEWNVHPMVSNFKVYCSMVPRIKVDKNGSCGIVHGTPAK